MIAPVAGMLSALVARGPALAASTVLLLLVLAVRGPVQRWAGPRLAYALWLLPAVRLVLPDLPGGTVLPAGSVTAMAVLVAGPRGPGVSITPTASLAASIAAVWLAGAVALFTLYAVRHAIFCRRLRATGRAFGRVDSVAVLTADVAGPLAFGVVRRAIAVPYAFERDYTHAEQVLALAHERTHHARGDLLANWLSLVVLAVHWWNPVAWVALRAFRADQELAADATVLAGRRAAAPLYAQVLAKAAGVGALPVCNLNARPTLKGRLMMLRRTPVSRRRRLAGAALLTLVGGAALAATATSGAAPVGRQVTTIGVKPDGAGGYALVIGDTLVAAGASLPRGQTLPADFSRAGGCDLTPVAKPMAMVIKGSGGTTTYTVMCGSAGAAPVRATLTEGLASLKTMRASVAVQQSAVFPPAERTHALGVIDRSIAAVEATLARG